MRIRLEPISRVLTEMPAPPLCAGCSVTEPWRKVFLRSAPVSLLLAAMAAMITAGCAPIDEPWDSTDYFKQERTRSTEQQRALQERAMQGETDRETGVQQLNRT